MRETGEYRKPRSVYRNEEQYAKYKRLTRRLLSSKRRTLLLKCAIGYSVYQDQIKDIYLNCPEGHEVDHIIPIQGKEVCGLHVPWNLQYLTKEDNRRKSNKVFE